MKYTAQVEIDLPLNEVSALFHNPNNLSKWQKGFTGMKHLKGVPGEVGSETKLFYKMGKREIEMVETITKNNLPQAFDATYVAKGVWNKVCNEFEKVSHNKTRWISHCEFKGKGFMAIMMLLMPGSFKKQTQQFMEQFKVFAESA